MKSAEQLLPRLMAEIIALTSLKSDSKRLAVPVPGLWFQPPPALVNMRVFGKRGP